ncbi:histone-lysine N-methyltransferase SETD2 isoform X2 [Cimex lectularius]|uniref:[histone H3]-lysine(36) N-trimethyltransferase n=1 Tax=Cimex lectularius TaxID=79782 RepID=A0A8I6RR88_CIMLE|nr:histone-lysine N-methyltransferase SETD2 isoform X2 [Cimex lectularius]
MPRKKRAKPVSMKRTSEKSESDQSVNGIDDDNENGAGEEESPGKVVESPTSAREAEASETNASSNCTVYSNFSYMENTRRYSTSSQEDEDDYEPYNTSNLLPIDIQQIVVGDVTNVTIHQEYDILDEDEEVNENIGCDIVIESVSGQIEDDVNNFRTSDKRDTIEPLTKDDFENSDLLHVKRSETDKCYSPKKSIDISSKSVSAIKETEEKLNELKITLESDEPPGKVYVPLIHHEISMQVDVSPLNSTVKDEYNEMPKKEPIFREMEKMELGGMENSEETPEKCNDLKTADKTKNSEPLDNVSLMFTEPLKVFKSKKQLGLNKKHEKKNKAAENKKSPEKKLSDSKKCLSKDNSKAVNKDTAKPESKKPIKEAIKSQDKKKLHPKERFKSPESKKLFTKEIKSPENKKHVSAKEVKFPETKKSQAMKESLKSSEQKKQPVKEPIVDTKKLNGEDLKLKKDETDDKKDDIKKPEGTAVRRRSNRIRVNRWEDSTITEVALPPPLPPPPVAPVVQPVATPVSTSTPPPPPLFDADKPVKVKSRWRRTSELEMGTGITSDSDTSVSSISTFSIKSESQNSPCLDTPLPSPMASAKLPLITTHPEIEERLKTYETVTSNIYLLPRTKSKEAKRMVCDCTLTKEEISRGEKGCGDDCLNRLLMIECGSRCSLGTLCSNKRFQNCEYSKCEVVKTMKKGLGLIASFNIECGAFLMEYVGEVIDPKEFRKRAKDYSKEKSRHFYFMALKSDAIIDATFKGNISRFINHSCDPNAETQKWTVNGELRIGFFSKRAIAKGEEVTFDYQLQRYGKEAQRCYCESLNCRGWIGEDPDKEKDREDKDKSWNRKERKDKEKKKKEEKRREYVNEMDLEEEIEKLSATGVKNQAHTLTLSRLMVRAEDLVSRSQLLEIAIAADRLCLRLFLDYHGLALLWSWMMDNQAPAKFRLQLLKTLEKLPITNKTILKDTKVLNIVEKWANPDDTSLGDKKERTGEDSNDGSPDSVETITPKGEGGNSQDGQMPEASPPNDEDSLAIVELAKSLISKWADLKEEYRIPKKERIEQMKEHEREADRGYCDPRDNLTYDRHWPNERDAGRYKEKDKRRAGRDSPDSRDNFDRRNKERNGALTSPRLTKVQRRQLFALQVEEEERQKRQVEEMWNKHQEQCSALGLDPAQTPFFNQHNGFPGFYHPQTGTWQPLPPETMINKVCSRKKVATKFFGVTESVMESAEMYRPGAAPPLVNQMPHVYAPPATPPPGFVPQMGGPPPGMGPPTIAMPQLAPPLGPQGPPPGGPPLVPGGAMGLGPPPGMPPTIVTGPFSAPPPGPFHQVPPQFTQPPPPLQQFSGPPHIAFQTPPPTQQQPQVFPQYLPQQPPPSLETIQMPPMQKPNVVVDTQAPILPPPPRKLPQGWKSAKDKEGRFYFYHVKVRKSQWQFPTNEDIAEADAWVASQHFTVEDETDSDEDESDSEDDDSSSDDDEDKEDEEEEEEDMEMVSSEKRKVEEEHVEQPPLQTLEEDYSPSQAVGFQESEPQLKKRREGLVQVNIISPRDNEVNYRRGIKKSKIRETKEKLARAKHKHKKEKVRKSKSMDSDSLSGPLRRIKDKFRVQMANVIVTLLNPYRKSDCKVARIQNTEDFKHLARKLTHFVMVKELKHVASIEELECNENVKHKAKDFIKKYMAKFGSVYSRMPDEC